MRDSLGFIEIDKIDHGDICFFRGYNHFYFEYEGKKYYFKKTYSIDTIYNELIAEEIAHEFGISSLHYDLASYYGTIGVISEDFVKDGELILLSEILHDDSYNNLEQIRVSLIMHYGQEITDILMPELINIFMFDILIGNNDRHTDNIGFIQNKNGISLAPVFDNDLMLSEIATEGDYYSMGIDRTDKNFDGHILKKFCGVYGDSYANSFEEKLGIISPENMERIFKRVEKRIGTEMNDMIKDKIRTNMFYYYQKLSKIMEERVKRHEK